MHQIETYIGCIHTELDIIMLIDLCQQDILARVTRRLTDPERKNIKNGSIFVYEEAESNIKRWTDGRIWSPSRCAGIFLTYTEYTTRAMNSPAFMKKTLTAKLKSKVYHVVAYVNLDDEMNGVCCFKYGNRLKLIYEEYIGTKRRCMIEDLYNKKRFGVTNVERREGGNMGGIDESVQSEAMVSPYISNDIRYNQYYPPNNIYNEWMNEVEDVNLYNQENCFMYNNRWYHGNNYEEQYIYDGSLQFNEKNNLENNENQINK